MKKVAYLLVVFCLLITTVQLYAQINNVTMKPYEFKSNSGEKVNAEIGEFVVPENRENPTGKTIKLGFIRFKSTNPNPSFPIVYLAGGPGGSGTGTAKGGRFELFMALREVADVIAFDQRGTGLSNQIPPCNQRANFDFQTPGSAEYYLGKMKGVTKSCLDFWEQEGVDVSAYNTRESAADINDLRKALGVDKLNLWGISYGSHLAFECIKQFGENINRVALASLEGPDQSIKLPVYNQNFLNYLAEKVAEDPLASKDYPDLIQSMKRVFNKLEEHSVMATGVDPRSGQAFEVAISKFDLQLITSFFLLKNPSNSKDLPYLYAKMEEGDFSGVAVYAAMLRLYSGRLRAMPFAMDAMSGISKKRWKLVQKQAETALLGRTTNFPYPDIAFEAGLPDLGKKFRQNPKSDVPALFFSGTLDGRTYVESAKELAQGFKNGVHVIIDGAGHDLFMSSPKVKELLLNFFYEKPVSSHRFSISMPKFKLKDVKDN